MDRTETFRIDRGGPCYPSSLILCCTLRLKLKRTNLPTCIHQRQMKASRSGVDAVIEQGSVIISELCSLSGALSFAAVQATQGNRWGPGRSSHKFTPKTNLEMLGPRRLLTLPESKVASSESRLLEHSSFYSRLTDSRSGNPTGQDACIFFRLNDSRRFLRNTETT